MNSNAPQNRNYCTLGKAALIIFAFDLYDNDSRCDYVLSHQRQQMMLTVAKLTHVHDLRFCSGKIDIEEIKLMLREVYGKEALKSAQATTVMGKIVEYGNNSSGDEEVCPWRVLQHVYLRWFVYNFALLPLFSVHIR